MSHGDRDDGYSAPLRELSRAHALTVVRPTVRFDRMVEFYGSELGWECVYEWDRGPEDRGRYFSPGADTGTATVEVLSLEGLVDPAAGKPANIALSIEVGDVDALHDGLIRRGVPIMRGLVDNPWGHRSFGIDDPDGLRIWFYEVIAVA